MPHSGSTTRRLTLEILYLLMKELVSTVGFLPRLCCRWIPPALPLQELNKSPDREKSMATTFAAGRGRVRLLDFSVEGG